MIRLWWCIYKFSLGFWFTPIKPKIHVRHAQILIFPTKTQPKDKKQGEDNAK